LKKKSTDIISGGSFYSIAQLCGTWLGFDMQALGIYLVATNVLIATGGDSGP